MKLIIDRLTNRKETIKDPLYDNPWSYGRLLCDSAKCTGCGTCRSLCPTKAISLREGKASVDSLSCIYCKICTECCKNGALTMTNDYKMAELEEAGQKLKSKIYGSLGRALTLRSVDTGSCNACMLELSNTQNTFYDLSRFGISFAASPRHSDGIVVTGPVAINMKQALVKSYYAMSEPRLVIAVGACAHDGGIFRDGHGNFDELRNILPVDLTIPGCPPSPQAIIYGLLKLVDRL